ncbi:MAG: hypothetical protein QME66_08560 [Candidatus Eisenbacteria bacterium]|nr:hypothetical protein [Candidatus Eisenbacteria bacterium]
MTGKTKKISFLIDRNEFKLIEESCLFGASAERNLKRAVKEADKYRIEFSYRELDDLAGYIAHCANHEESEYKQRKWYKLQDKVEGLLIPPDTKNEVDLLNSLLPALATDLRYYVFDVWIESGRARPMEEKILRRIQIADTQSLYNFAKVITRAFGFFFDHCFGFYDNFQKYHDSKKSYELFPDIGEEPLRPTTKGVKKTKICQAFKNVGEKMLFLYDYGDGWRFVVELKEIKYAEKRDLRPVILESIGTAPIQYPPCEEEFRDDEDLVN